MINELYTLVNNAIRSPGVIGYDLVDPDFKPVSMDVAPQNLLNTLIGETEQARQYWLALVRSVFVDVRFWSEPLSYFDKRGGYALSDIRKELDRYRQLRVDAGLKVETSNLFWRAKDYTVARWNVAIRDTNAELSLLSNTRPSKTVDFNAANVAVFSLDTNLQILVYKRGVSGQIVWATSPTDTLINRVHLVQTEGKGNLFYLASAPSRFPQSVISGLKDLAMCTSDVHRAAGAILLIVGGHLAALHDEAV